MKENIQEIKVEYVKELVKNLGPMMYAINGHKLKALFDYIEYLEHIADCAADVNKRWHTLPFRREISSFGITYTSLETGEWRNFNYEEIEKLDRALRMLRND